MIQNIEERKDCPMRHECGNCLVMGGFCVDGVSDEICHALHQAYDKGSRDGAERMKKFVGQKQNPQPLKYGVACPSCGRGIGKMPGYKFCHYCGQAIEFK